MKQLLIDIWKNSCYCYNFHELFINHYNAKQNKISYQNMFFSSYFGPITIIYGFIESFKDMWLHIIGLNRRKRSDLHLHDESHPKSERVWGAANSKVYAWEGWDSNQKIPIMPRRWSHMTDRKHGELKSCQAVLSESNTQP